VNCGKMPMLFCLTFGTHFSIMRNLNLVCLAVLATFVFAACRKTPDYVAVPFDCECGVVTWQGVEYPLLGTTYILTDSTNAKSRRYYITADVSLEGEEEAHGLSAWIQVPDIGNGGSFSIDAQSGESDFEAWVDEFNPNDPTDTLRQYVPVNAVVQISAAPVSGGTETVNFQLTLNQLEDGEPVPGDINCSGSFTVAIRP
jgi:hypothetical protein